MGLSPVQTDQDRRGGRTYRGILWGRCAHPGRGCMLHRTGGVKHPASELLRTLLLRDWVNGRFPRLAPSFSQWQHRGTVKGKGAGFRLTVEVRENVAARTSENTYLLGR